MIFLQFMLQRVLLSLTFTSMVFCIFKYFKNTRLLSVTSLFKYFRNMKSLSVINLTFLFLTFNPLIQKAHAAEFIIGSSAHHAKDEDEAEYARGAIVFLNKMVDKNAEFAPRIIFYENNNNANRDVDNTKRLVMVDKARILFGFANREGVENARKFLADKKAVPFCFPKISYVENDKDILLRPNIKEELKLIQSYLLEKIGRVVVVYDDEYQKEYFKELSNVFFIKSEAVNKTVYEVKKLKPEYIVFLGKKDPAKYFIRAAMFTTLKSANFFLPFYLVDSSLIKYLEEKKPNVYVVNIFPNFYSEDDEVKDYIKCSKRYKSGFTMGFSGLEGFISMKILYTFLASQSEEVLNDNVKLIEALKKENFSKHLSIRVEKVFGNTSQR